MPEISVIVPIYNTAPFLEECLESIAAQTFPDFEAILVDDGSTDSSASIAERFVKRDSRFHLISQHNLGLSEARNTGLRNARGNWIAFVDSDDVLAPDFFKALWKAAIEMDVPVVASGKIAFTHRIPQTKFECGSLQKISSEEALLRAFYQNAVPDFSAWNKLYKKSLWENRKFPPGIYFEDMATIPAVLHEAVCIGICQAPLYFYRKHSTSILASPYTLKKAELLAIAEKNLETFKHVSPQVRKAAESLLVSASFSILMRTPKSEEFSRIRKRAFGWIKKFRTQILWDRKTRLRNKAAVLGTFGPSRFLAFILRRFG